MSDWLKLSRRTFLRASALMAAATLVGCAPKATPAPAAEAAEEPAEAAPEAAVATATPVPAAPKEKVDVRFQARGDEAIFAVFRQLKTDFESRVEGINVIIEETPTEWWQKLQISVAGGTAPDCCFSAAGNVLNAARLGLHEPLNPYLEVDDRYNYDDFFPISLYNGEYQKQYYHLPYDGGMMVLNYNTDMFDAEGLTYPDAKTPLTWDEYAELAMKLTKDMDGKSADQEGFDPTRIQQYGCNPETWMFYQWVRWAGGDLFAEEDRDQWQNCTLGSTEAIEAVQFLADLGYKYNCAPSPAFQQSSPINLFNGNLAMDFQGVWNNVRQRQVEFGWNVAPLIQGKERHPLGWWSGISMIPGGKVKQEAYEWSWYLTSEEGQSIVTKLGQAVPHLKKLAYSEVFLDPTTEPENDQAYLDELEDPGATTLWGWPYYIEMGNLVSPELDPVWRGEKTAAEVMPGLAEKMTHLAQTGEVLA